MQKPNRSDLFQMAALAQVLTEAEQKSIKGGLIGEVDNTMGYTGEDDTTGNFIVDEDQDIM